MIKPINIIKVASFLGSIFIGIYFGAMVEISKQLAIVDTTITYSSIIFGVMGVWISLLYPQAIQENKIRDSIVKKSIFTSMFYATLNLFFCIIFKLSYPILTQISFLIQHKELIRVISFTFVLFLNLQLIITLFSILLPADLLNRKLQEDKARDDHNNRMWGDRKKSD